MKKTIGIFAHVDAGKTTLSELLLYKTNAIREAGRVDSGNTTLDCDETERQRGITIFSDTAKFMYNDNEYYLVDTPGHADFSPEAERAIKIIDYAIVVVSATDGVQPHTKTLFGLLRRCDKPVFFFINKSDIETADKSFAMQSLRDAFSDCPDFTYDCSEDIALYSDALFEEFEKNGDIRFCDETKRLIADGVFFPCFYGSALRDSGVDFFLQSFDALTYTQYDSNAPFRAQIFKVRCSEDGNRVCFLKILSGTLHAKDKFVFGDSTEKINEIRFYKGAKFVPGQNAFAGDLCAVCGLAGISAGDFLGEGENTGFELSPALMCSVLYDEKISPREILRIMRILEDEEPTLGVSWNEELCDIQIHIMGKIQLEILTDEIRRRFGIEVSFGECKIMYRETITTEVCGYGHFEPLRHYSEVHLRLTPLSRAEGIRFDSELSTDVLPRNYQKLIKTHVFEKQHRGALTGAPITDIKITLINGRAHEKHTSGGDFREATYRAIRQGLFSAQSLLLEPFYEYEIEAPVEYAGRIIGELSQMNAKQQPPQRRETGITLCGNVPVACALDYPAQLACETSGAAQISLRVSGYDVCHNADEVIEKIGYEKERDTNNSASSVFVSHGAAYTVAWNEAPSHMHLL